MEEATIHDEHSLAMCFVRACVCVCGNGKVCDVVGFDAGILLGYGLFVEMMQSLH